MARPFRAYWLAFAVLPVIVVELSSCSDDPKPDPIAPIEDASFEQRPKPGDPDAQAEDVTDARVPLPPPPVLPGCIGPSRSLIPSGERTYISVNMGGDAGKPKGDFLLDFGANVSTIDLGGFQDDAGGPVPSSCLGDAASPGAFCYFPNFDFFGPWGVVGLGTNDYRFLINSVRQAGIIGTDFLALYPFTVEYTNNKISMGSDKPTTFCTDTQLLAAGMTPIPVTGFYSKVISNLRPLSDVIMGGDAAATANIVVPNIPAVPVTIAGVAATAQVDTGYDDRIIRHSINVNKALMDKILATSPSSVTRQPSKDLFLTTCIPGLSQKGTAYVLTAGTEVNFINSAGAVGRKDSGTIIFVKENLAEADRCGGIETWTVPAAQLGASFMVDAQAVVFDPITSRVWLPKN